MFLPMTLPDDVRPYGSDPGDHIAPDTCRGPVPESAEKVEKVSAPNERELKKYGCIHMTWRKIATVKLRDRMEFLKECRRCQHKRVFVVQTTAGQSRVFLNQFYYDPPHVKYQP